MSSSLPATKKEGFCAFFSCLHAIEHFGLDCYGDPIDPQVYERGIVYMRRFSSQTGSSIYPHPSGESE
jgi:hypothetical protein